MKNILFLAFLCLSMMVFSQKIAKKEAVKVTPPSSFTYESKELGGKLKTDFPNGFTTKTNQDTKGKTVNVSAQRNGTAYLLNYMVHIYPLGILPASALADAALNNFSEISKAEIIESNDFEKGELKGKSALLINHEKGKMYEYRCFFVNQLEVQMMVIHPVGFSEENNISKFFNSFVWQK